MSADREMTLEEVAKQYGTQHLAWRQYEALLSQVSSGGEGAKIGEAFENGKRVMLGFVQHHGLDEAMRFCDSLAAPYHVPDSGKIRESRQLPTEETEELERLMGEWPLLREYISKLRALAALAPQADAQRGWLSWHEEHCDHEPYFCMGRERTGEACGYCQALNLALLDRQEGWRPIETAEKLAGKKIWGCDNRTPLAPIYYSIQWQGIGSHGAGWYTCWDATYVSGAVTHWQPLPPAPKSEGE